MDPENLSSQSAQYRYEAQPAAVLHDRARLGDRWKQLKDDDASRNPFGPAVKQIRAQQARQCAELQQGCYPAAKPVQAAHAKNRGRIRTVPLAPDAVWAIERLQDRAKELGASGPQHYLFPFCQSRDVYNPDKPMTNSGIKKPFEAIRARAGVPWFRQHDIRHTAITRWAEAAVPIPTIMSWAGHLTQKMLLHYTHISDQAARLAMNQVYGRSWSQKPPQSSTGYLWKSAKRG